MGSIILAIAVCSILQSIFSYPIGECEVDEFQCGSGVCIPIRWVCDGTKDCLGGRDEMNCNPPNCSKALFSCSDGKLCLEKGRVCNGRSECKDGSDEWNCIVATNRTNENASTPTNKTIDLDPRNAVGVRNSAAKVAIVSRADTNVMESSIVSTNPMKSVAQKLLAHQTSSCKLFHGISDRNFQCNTSKACIPKFWICDTECDCKDCTDELFCDAIPENKNRSLGSRPHNSTANQCLSTDFPCRGGQCIPERWRCDRERDCRLGDDEEHCELCRHQFKCAKGTRCIYSSWVCDGESDCLDGSDEIGCENSTPTIQTTETSANETQDVNAPGFCIPELQFPCSNNGRCIPNRWVCDGDFDCTDKSDEENCHIFE